VPRISYFYGIAIYMYHRDHAPPHFHAIYGEREAEISIDGLDMLKGDLTARDLRLVREWAETHVNELMDNWRAASRRQPLTPIPPLE
jgi:hypothetical protein